MKLSKTAQKSARKFREPVELRARLEEREAETTWSRGALIALILALGAVVFIFILAVMQ